MISAESLLSAESEIPSASMNAAPGPRLSSIKRRISSEGQEAQRRKSKGDRNPSVSVTAAKSDRKKEKRDSKAGLPQAEATERDGDRSKRNTLAVDAGDDISKPKKSKSYAGG